MIRLRRRSWSVTPRGFTLIELMIVVLVVAILASIAVPSYRQYVMRSNRTDATTALLRLQAAQEKFFLQNMRYANNLAAAPPAGLGLPANSDGGHYALALVMGAGDMSYDATATPQAGDGQVDDARCTSFSIDETGRRSATGGAADPDAECWR